MTSRIFRLKYCILGREFWDQKKIFLQFSNSPKLGGGIAFTSAPPPLPATTQLPTAHPLISAYKLHCLPIQSSSKSSYSLTIHSNCHQATWHVNMAAKARKRRMLSVLYKIGYADREFAFLDYWFPKIREHKLLKFEKNIVAIKHNPQNTKNDQLCRHHFSKDSMVLQ